MSKYTIQVQQPYQDSYRYITEPIDVSELTQRNMDFIDKWSRVRDGIYKKYNASGQYYCYCNEFPSKSVSELLDTVQDEFEKEWIEYKRLAEEEKARKAYRVGNYNVGYLENFIYNYINNSEDMKGDEADKLWEIIHDEKLKEVLETYFKYRKTDHYKKYNHLVHRYYPDW